MSSLENLMSLRRNLNRETEEYRHEFLRQLESVIENWEGQLPNLRDCFRPEEIERLLSDSVNCLDAYVNDYRGKRFIEFVSRSGYKNEPEVDKDGKPVLRRTTPIHHATRRRFSAVIPDLFKIYDRFDLNYTDELGLTHFHAVCMSGCADVVSKFLEFGQDPNLVWPETGDLPLHLALKNGHEDVAESLLKHGADLKLENEEGLTPLHIICIGNDDDAMEMFFKIIDDVQQPLQLDAQDKSGNAPLHLALAKGCKKLVKLLLRRGANPNLVDADGLTSLHLSCMRNDDGDLVKMLFEFSTVKHHPVQVDAKDKVSGRTPLHYALAYGWKPQILRVLLTNGANPNLADKNGSTPLHIICKRCCDHNDLAELFFKINDDANQLVHVNAQDNSGNTPLYYALSYGHRKLVESLLKNGADPNLINKEGLTALHIICQRYGNDDLMQIFFKICDDKHQRLRVDASDKLGHTPLQLAVVNLFPKTIDLLLDHGADLSSFVFPTESYFEEHLYEASSNSKLILASGLLAVAEILENRGYKLDRSDALTIMKLFANHGLFVKSKDLIKSMYDDEEFAKKAKEIMINSSLSLYDLIQLRPKEAEKRLTYSDYFKFCHSDELGKIPISHFEACIAYLCEKLSRKFFRQWALDSFLELIRYQLPNLCCEKIIEPLTNEDLWRICLTPTGQSLI